MKIRTGFVSNSSSSSFLIAYKPSPRCESCGLKAPDIIVKMDRSIPSHSDNTVYAEGKDAVIAYLSGIDFHDALEIAKNTELRPGEDLAYIAVSYHDSELNELLQNNKSIRILQSEG